MIIHLNSCMRVLICIHNENTVWLICLLFITLHRIRVPYPFQWGAPTFDAGEAFAMMAASFVALVEVYLLGLYSLLIQPHPAFVYE